MITFDSPGFSRFVFTFSRRGFAKREDCVYARELRSADSFARFGAPRGSTQARTSAQTNEILTMTIQFVACYSLFEYRSKFRTRKEKFEELDSPSPSQNPEIFEFRRASEVRILRVSLNQLLDIQRFLEFSKIFRCSRDDRPS